MFLYVYITLYILYRFCYRCVIICTRVQCVYMYVNRVLHVLKYSWVFTCLSNMKQGDFIAVYMIHMMVDSQLVEGVEVVHFRILQDCNNSNLRNLKEI